MLNGVQTDLWPNAEMGSELDPTVLIVDDDIDAANELAEALEFEGFRCITAHTPEKALSLTSSVSSINVVITDFYLWGDATASSNGLALVEDIRNELPARKLEFIVVSGDQDVLVDCTITGVAKFLAKPIAPESICSMVKDASLQTLEEPAADDSHESVTSLHRVVQVQAKAITSLTQALNDARTDSRKASDRLDRLVSAASIAQKRNDDVGCNDVGELLRYVVGQGYSVKKLISKRPVPTKQADVVNITNPTS